MLSNLRRIIFRQPISVTVSKRLCVTMSKNATAGEKRDVKILMLHGKTLEFIYRCFIPGYTA